MVVVHAVWRKGAVAVSGTVAATGTGGDPSRKVCPTAGRVPNGATVEVPNPKRAPAIIGPMTLNLKNPDFSRQP